MQWPQKAHAPGLRQEEYLSCLQRLKSMEKVPEKTPTRSDRTLPGAPGLTTRSKDASLLRLWRCQEPLVANTCTSHQFEMRLQALQARLQALQESLPFGTEAQLLSGRRSLAGGGPLLWRRNTADRWSPSGWAKSLAPSSCKHLCSRTDLEPSL